MTAYECPRCAYSTGHLANFLTHLSRKKECKALHSDVSTEKIKSDFLKTRDDERKHECVYCKTKFKFSSSRNRHMSTCDKRNKNTTVDNNKLTKMMLALSRQIAQVQKSVDKKISVSTQHKPSSQLRITLPPNERIFNFQTLDYSGQYETVFQNILEIYYGNGHKRIGIGETDITTETTHIEIKRWSNYKDGIGQLVSYNSVDPKQELVLYLFGKCGQETRTHAGYVFENLSNSFKFYEIYIKDKQVFRTNIISLETEILCNLI